MTKDYTEAVFHLGQILGYTKEGFVYDAAKKVQDYLEANPPTRLTPKRVSSNATDWLEKDGIKEWHSFALELLDDPDVSAILSEGHCIAHGDDNGRKWSEYAVFDYQIPILIAFLVGRVANSLKAKAQCCCRICMEGISDDPSLRICNSCYNTHSMEPKFIEAIKSKFTNGINGKDLT